MRVLVVEDDPLLGDATQAGLRQAGFTVDWVTDGAAAATRLATESFSAVVLDLGLPRLSGLDLLRRLRRQGNPVPVLILTARDTTTDSSPRMPRTSCARRSPRSARRRRWRGTPSTTAVARTRSTA